jgi:hypothetical protein
VITTCQSDLKQGLHQDDSLLADAGDLCDDIPLFGCEAEERILAAAGDLCNRNLL